MGTEQASELHRQYARRAGPIGLTVEELDFVHFPAKNGFPGIPGEGVDPVPELRGAGGRRGLMPGRRKPRK